jgi:phosphate transport system permease protein
LLVLGGLAAMVTLLASQSLPAWRHSGTTLLTGVTWFYRAERFGALPMIAGTMAVALIALILAAPVGIGAALFASEVAPPRFRTAIRMAMETLAGVPSVVYGLLGILLLRNAVYQILTPLDPLSGDTVLTAGILLAIMVLPTIMSVSDDAFRSVSLRSRQAARCLGLTRAEVMAAVVLPQARRGIIAALLLSFGRAIGETIAVFLVIGRQDNQPLALRSIMEAGQTLTSKLGGAETNIAYGHPQHWAAIIALGLILLLLGGTVSLLAHIVIGPDPDSGTP